MAEKLLTVGGQDNVGKWPLDLLFRKREGLVGDGTAGGYLGLGNHGKMIFDCQRGKERHSRTATLDFQRKDFGMIGGLAEKIPWEGILKDKGIQEHWIFSKYKILKVQELIDSMCQKMREWGRLAWLNRHLCLEFREKREAYNL